jgi:hypothetical protein
VSMMNPLAGPAGPGKFSTRTDNLQMGSTAYGEGKETAAINTGAPKSKTRGIADDVGGRPVSTVDVPQGELTSLYAPSQRASEPITNGIDMGAGAGSSALMMQSQLANRKMSDILAEMIPYDTTGEIQYLYQDALSRGN